MDKYLPQIFRIVLMLAALAAVPVSTWVQGHPAFEGFLGFVASLLALFIHPPGAAKAEPEVDL